MADRIDELIAAGRMQQRRDAHFRALAVSETIVGAARAPEYWYRRGRRFDDPRRPARVAEPAAAPVEDRTPVSS